jgi:hypothetical protein
MCAATKPVAGSVMRMPRNGPEQYVAPHDGLGQGVNRVEDRVPDDILTENADRAEDDLSQEVHTVDRARRFVMVAAAVSLLAVGCGSDEVSKPVPSAPATLLPASGDLLDPAAWIGHQYAEGPLASPYQHVILDGTDTGFMTMRVGTPSEPDPIGFPAFVRPYSDGLEPGPWVVLAWRPADPMNWQAGGPVYDALAATAVENEMPMSGCRSSKGESGVFLGFVVYDPAYTPAPDNTETAPFPVTKAWRITDDLQLESVAADGVECDMYTFGD